MKRRDFLKTAGVLAGSPVLSAATVGGAAHREKPRPMQIALMNTFIDWYFGWSPEKGGNV